MTDGYGNTLDLGDDAILRGRVVSMRGDLATLELYGTWMTGGPLRVVVPSGALVRLEKPVPARRRRKLKRTA